MADIVIVSDSLAAVRTKARTRSETVTVSEQALREQLKVRPLPTQTLTISDAVVRLTAKAAIKTLSDNVTISDSALLAKAKTRTISETTTIAETIQAYKNDEPLIPPIPPALPEVPNLIGTRERAVRAVRRAPRAIVIDEIKNVAIAPLKLLAFSDSNNKAIAKIGIKPRPTPNVALSKMLVARSQMSLAQCSIKTQLQPMEVKANMRLPLSSLHLTTAKLKLRPQAQSIHALKAVNFEKMHKLTRIMKVAMLIENLS